LVRLASHRERPDIGGNEEDSRLLDVLESLPDSFVVINDERRIISANAAFYGLAQVATESQVLDQPLDRWLGRPGVDLNIMLANLREHGSVRNFATVIQGELGVTEQVEISAVAANNGSTPCYGFIIRTVQANAPLDPATTDLPQSVQQLTGLVGRVSLKEIVRETTDVIERLCIEAALEVSGGNRASAAQILGLSRQSLYSKLHRHSISGLGGDDEEQ
ncbi:MAG: helix-turn-helix domain-containing protein, partial [Myxococcota bacterium]